jgi:mannitol/fructose-specific phosphotransferase system IIA component (Ntr-type)
VAECEVIDIGKQLTHVEFFTVVAEKLAGRLNIDVEELLDSFISREAESTTAIRPGLAIPHITIDGEQRFELLIARCEAGITFSEELPPVYAAFVLVGSRDERDFHLRALSAIAQITHDTNFDKDWLRAKNLDELRDIVLLAKRRR